MDSNNICCIFWTFQCLVKCGTLLGLIIYYRSTLKHTGNPIFKYCFWKFENPIFCFVLDMCAKRSGKVDLIHFDFLTIWNFDPLKILENETLELLKFSNFRSLKLLRFGNFETLPQSQIAI